MGISIVVWRARIGLFFGASKGAKTGKSEMSKRKCKCLFFLIYLLVIGGVELNPGPSIEDVYKLIQDSTEKMEKHFKELNQKIDNVENSLKQQVNKNLERIDNLEAENLKLKVNIQELIGKQDDLENRSRRDNLIFFGIKESDEDNESWHDCKNKLLEVINGVMELNEVTGEHIARAHRLGHRKGKRPIIVKFIHYGIKEKILEARSKLKDTDIFINEDFSQKVREERKHLLAVMKEAKGKGAKAKVIFNKLKVDGQLYKYDWEVKKVVPIEYSDESSDEKDREGAEDTQLIASRVTRQKVKKAQEETSWTPGRGRIDGWLRPKGGSGRGRNDGGGGSNEGGGSQRANSQRGGGKVK